MLRYLLLPAGAAVMLSAAAGPALADPVPAVVTPLTASSSAAILHFQFNVNGKKTDSGLEVPTSGSAPPAYDKTATKSTYSKSTQILGGLTFDRSATGIQSVVTGRAAAATGTDATASATIGSFHGTLESPLGKLLTVTTGKITSKASFTQTKAGVRTVKGSTSLLTVHIDAPALGINKTYSGSPLPNHVLYHNGNNSIVIYLNRQITTKLNDKVTALAVYAIDVQISNYKLLGSTITGTVTVAPTVAR
jgi:hypothetical protein